MALKRCLLSCIVITISIVPSNAAWNSDIHRYESYNLERGPVIYEAYYPDSNEESRNNVQEKRYFDREAVLEKTYQLPSQRLVYSESPVGFNNYPNEREVLDAIPRTKTQPLDIRELSSLARRAISRDLENWNTLEQYLDRVTYQDPSYRGEIVDPNYRIEQSIREIEPKLSDSSRRDHDLRRELYEEIREEPVRVPLRLEDRGDSMRMLGVRDLTGRDSSYQNRSPESVGKGEEAMAVAIPKEMGVQDSKTIMDPYPTENIFAPRPQVINYVFSRKPGVPEESKAQQSVPETKDTAESMPRSYGDNLIRDEIKKTEENKDVKVTSIEVSEVPRHKTRHHHGEWPKRDYPRHRRS